MGITQIQAAEQLRSQVPLSNNPFIPPDGGVSLINDLPHELLSRIFELGSEDDAIEDKEEDIADLLHQVDAGGTQENDIHDRDAEMTQDDVEEDGDEDGYEDEDEDENEGGDEEDEDKDEDEDDVNDGDASDEAEFYIFPPFPLLVSHVCRHWRNVALSTPSLWTTIVVTPGARPPYEPILTQLERSKGLPISVSCELDKRLEYPDGELELLFAMLIPHIHRWRTMKVMVMEYHDIHPFLHAVSSSAVTAAPQLKTLELHYHSVARTDMWKHLTLFSSAPLLTKLVLDGVHVDWDQPWIASAPNLRELKLAYYDDEVSPSWTQFSTILRGASSLQKLGLCASGPSGEPHTWTGPADINTPIQLARVTDFKLASYRQSHAIGLLRKLSLPALRHLVLALHEVRVDYTQFVHELAGPATCLSLGQKQQGSLPSRLESLTIIELACRAAECVETLYAELQKLMSLNISLPGVDSLFLDILSKPCTFPGCGDVWLPRLTTLYVSGTSGSHLREVVSNRREMGAPLLSLYVDRCCYMDEKHLAWFKENLETFDIIKTDDDLCANEIYA